MDRQSWLAERRSAVVASYDRVAPNFDEHPYPADTHSCWVSAG